MVKLLNTGRIPNHQNPRHKSNEERTIRNLRLKMRGSTDPAKLPTWLLAEPKLSKDRPLFDDPMEFWRVVKMYFDWASENPLESRTSFATGAMLEQKPRPFSLRGLAAFCGTTVARLQGIRKLGDDFDSLMDMAEEAIWNQKFDYAVINVFNSSIISRDLGLTEKQEVSSALTVSLNGKDAEL